jgi:hypothetical protein
MGDAGVAPVHEQIAVVLDEDLTVVEVVVLDRLRDTVGRQFLRRLPHPGNLLAQAPDQRVVAEVDHDVLDEGLEPAGQHGQAQVGDAPVDEFLSPRGTVDLDTGVQRQDVEPPAQAPLTRDNLT